MTRAQGALAAAWWWVTLAAVLVWWAPSLALMAARLLLDRARFRAGLAWVAALRLAGRDAAALRALERAARRCELRAARVRSRRAR